MPEFAVSPKLAPVQLEPPNTHHLRAAIGWLELGSHVEAGEEIARIASLDVDQLHGEESAEQFPALTVWKAVRVTPEADLSKYRGCAAEALLLDEDSDDDELEWEHSSLLQISLDLGGAVHSSSRTMNSW